ncbi:hypothetical protein HU200_050958 [Digitaria exilis]|uniref:Uncharacterized protein n=1 Tax=Digitaria exilis TaxID=1010633 RepID=A0A835ALH1_9POAL|nr:hypothetical protein HU200_050958 [Digitaria exilis]
MAAVPDAMEMAPPVPAEPRRRSPCPGCRVDKRKAEREGMFPYKELFLIWLVTLCYIPVLFPH